MWCCSKNHVWNAPLSRIKNLGQWCLQCAGKVKLTLEVAKQIALLKSGQCLSEKYINNRLPLLWSCIKGHLWYASLSNSKTPMTWKCHQGHVWNSSFKHIKNSGTWYPYCAGIAKLTLEDAKQIAHLHYLGEGNVFRLSIK